MANADSYGPDEMDQEEVTMNTGTRIRATVAAVIAVMLVACQGADTTDKAGSETTTLRLATIDSVNNNGQSYGPEAFVDGLEEVSGGRLRVEVLETYGDGAPDAESNLVRAIADGEIDGGWPSTRAFANAGIGGLEPVEAPLTITSYAAQKAVVSGPVADDVLQRLDDSGVVGLGLAVGPLRRPFATEAPLLEPADWQGAKVRAYNSPVQSEAIHALGGTPVNVSFEWIDELRAGNLRGAEFDIAQYAANGFTTEAGNVAANVVLWPKVFVLSLSQRRFDALTEQQQQWVREAADRAVEASVDAQYDETSPARELCAAGARFVDASPEQLDELRAATKPVIDQLAADPDSGPLLEDIQAIAAEHPQPETPDLPAGCRQGTTASAVASEASSEVSDLPEGVYRVEITEADVQAAGLSNADGWSGTWTLTIADGTYVLDCAPIDQPGTDCGNSTQEGPYEAGYVHGIGGTVDFIADPALLSEATGCELPPANVEGHCWENASYTMTWSTDGDELVFEDAGSVSPNQDFLIEPWRRID